MAKRYEGPRPIDSGMQAPLRFSLADKEGKVSVAGDAAASIEDGALTIAPKEGEAMAFSLRDVDMITERDYRIRVDLADQGSLMLFNLGYKYEDFARGLVKARNEQTLQDLLMEEKLRKQGVPADYSYDAGSAGGVAQGRCEVRLYETALVIMPERSDLVRIPYSEIVTAKAENLRLAMRLESGGILELSRLGRELDPLAKGVEDSMAALSSMVQRMLKDVLPGADPASILRASRYMKEGRAARKGDLETACPGLWPALEMKIAGLGLGEEYAFLSAKAQRDRVRIGMKRTLMGEAAGDYIWLLAPIYSADPSTGGNAIAFEATSGEDEGRATYFFRIMGREQYRQARDPAALDRAAEEGLAVISRGLMAINFRREPIYIPEERLYAPEYSRYRYSMMRVPELRTLRERFAGRVVHSSAEQWKADVDELLGFNVSQKGDAAVWRRTEQEEGR